MSKKNLHITKKTNFLNLTSIEAAWVKPTDRDLQNYFSLSYPSLKLFE